MKQPIDTETLSALIGAIYDCAVDPDRWTETIERVRIELDFGNAALTLWDMPTAGVLLNVMTGTEPVWIERTKNYGQDVLDQWGGQELIQSLPLGEPVVLSQLRDRQLWVDNRFFQEWARPQGIHDVMSIPLARDSSMISTIAWGRHDSAGEIGEFEVAAARLISPHMTRAVTIGRLLDMRSVIATTFEATLNLLAVAVLVVDTDLRIVHANNAAEQMLARGDPIAARGGVLSVRSRAAAKALSQAVRQGADDESAIGRRGLGVPVVSADQSPSVLHVLPLRHGALRPGLSPTAAAAIFVAPAVSPHPAPKEALAALFDLTPAEAQVFVLIASGLTPAEAARRLAIGGSTIKTHLLRVFAKTGTKRQADLVKLGASLALPL